MNHEDFAAVVDARSAEELTNVGSEKWRSGPDMLGAAVAEHDLGLASPIERVLTEIATTGRTGYIYQDIYDRFRNATVGFLSRKFGWEVSPSAVRMVPDVITVLDGMLQGMVPRGADVIVPVPAYMPFLQPFVENHGHRRVTISMVKDNGGWRYDLQALEDAFRDGAKLLVLCNPHNPVGRVLDREELEAIHEIVARHDGLVFSDEIHAPIAYSGHQHVPFASLNDDAASRTVTAIAASKAFNVAGLKCAQVIVPHESMASGWSRFGKFLEGRTSTPGLLATTAAYNDGDAWLRAATAYLERTRDALPDLFAEHLPEVEYMAPEGTFLAWLDFGEKGRSIAKASNAHLGMFFETRAKVRTTAGIMCDPTATGSVRLNFGAPLPLVEQMVMQMGRALR